MTELRDLIRDTLSKRKPPIVIGANSAIWDTFDIMVPPALRTFNITIEYRCSNKNCIKKLALLEMESTDSNGKGTKGPSRPHIKRMALSSLSFAGGLHQNSDTQTILTQSVV